jgi:hypothetical protein
MHYTQCCALAGLSLSLGTSSSHALNRFGPARQLLVANFIDLRPNSIQSLSAAGKSARLASGLLCGGKNIPRLRTTVMFMTAWVFEARHCPTLPNDVKKTKLHIYTSPQAGINILLAACAFRSSAHFTNYSVVFSV